MRRSADQVARILDQSSWGCLHHPGCWQEDQEPGIRVCGAEASDSDVSRRGQEAAGKEFIACWVRDRYLRMARRTEFSSTDAAKRAWLKSTSPEKETAIFLGSSRHCLPQKTCLDAFSCQRTLVQKRASLSERHQPDVCHHQLTCLYNPSALATRAYPWSAEYTYFPLSVLHSLQPSSCLFFTSPP